MNCIDYYMSWARSFYLRERSSLYRQEELCQVISALNDHSDHSQARWARWASCSSCSLWSLLIQAIRAITSRLWLLNDYLIIVLFNHLQKSFNTRFSSKIFVSKITFSSCLLIAQQRTLSCVAEIFLSVRVLSVLSCVSVNTAVACKRNVVLTTNSIVASSVCISIASAISLSRWWSEKE